MVRITNIAAAIDEMFLRRDFRQDRRWVHDDEVKVYLRSSRKFIEQSYDWWIDLASIEVEEESRNQGIMAEILAHCETVIDRKSKLGGDPLVGIHVESVLNPDLAQALLRRGFVLDPSSRAFEDQPFGNYFRRSGA